HVSQTRLSFKAAQHRFQPPHIQQQSFLSLQLPISTSFSSGSSSCSAFSSGNGSIRGASLASCSSFLRPARICRDFPIPRHPRCLPYRQSSGDCCMVDGRRTSAEMSG
ncbi:unnamed protein product, partial [Closterium sp. Yama58-4]